MSYIILLAGFVLLIKGADYFVEGASNIAIKLSVSPLLVGLTIVAFGTSSPEATVSILAALEENAGMVLGNIVGSNIFNITVVLGVTAMIAPLTVKSETIRKEIPFSLLAAVVLLVLMADVFLSGAVDNIVSRGDGLIILLFFSVFLYYVFEMAMKNRAEMDEGRGSDVGSSWGKNILWTVGGLAAIIFGGRLVVDSATEIALSLGMSETLVGLTIVAIGTSLPELITSVTAAIRKQGDIAIGNAVGSCIFNIFFVAGSAATVAPLTLDAKIFTDTWVMILLTVLLLIFSRTRYSIGRVEGFVLVIAYTIYMVYIIIRN
ncbi:MAG TPA: calcium/sodium antiporter [Candidatus Salinicoccus stercoripullorum]|uniref:Calcium/sodium antiporter n=1 Tax=Candidatus Salinicoccus stercoripullorum TaxID=2838756 RepID=A0A9D1QGF3_9STAP|nr:calcium/sodium antiporter [Candidatus Salinicoccus stercoripullorum]